MKKYHFSAFLLFYFLSFIFGFNSLAHGLGQSLEKEVNGYFIDVGYDAVDSIEAGVPIRFDFNLLTKDRLSTEDFTSVWVKIAPRDKGLSFAGFLHRPEFLLTGMSYTFQNAGQYEITVRFLDKEDKNLAEASFPLEVQGGDLEQQALLQAIGAGIGGLVLGAITAWLLKNKKTS
ncbi:MAG: hypothetical protein A3B86_03030 [Candidatus Yanofskybacteria bacterium RIFCSPHIGHO2_02_FULL_38_22b]|uniref:YtkA-like domain-containing protein n=1 Tax=Candidatus Yanofskybacteria bacterium RIFCSPHIGHO2_02_FULL_38_22b TaxID=1802673 RepID=A0A1F8F3M6_9BACT|nr:MAG: hypothetical protein A2816_02625 [Candidatus Yanofskybacteria bacterium RIFCSPHIGHO2_01_FULL_39_44]OGN06846.1 MAG: hypothetical protein A3B86_03030 [Candidatus Yanofskybacteria bacterium RIFCSPHIGHO2_02_FULL_38_22b]OGN20741.1 MAG: hypothetical protein A2910_00990 [Candidatus Yanofskybacteria bacterium RIFCSPLOWO2_01_FULL_39_28]